MSILLVRAALLVTATMLTACERPQPRRMAHERRGEPWAPSDAQPQRSAPALLPSEPPPFQRAECVTTRSKMGAYAYALTDAVGKWLHHNEPLLEQFKHTSWDDIPETAQIPIAARMRQDFKEEVVKRAIASNSPASTFACKPEFRNCWNVAGNLDLVGDYYVRIIRDKTVDIAKMAQDVARKRTRAPAEQWRLIDRLDQLLYEMRSMLPESAVLAELEYPVEPPGAASCHQAKRRVKRAHTPVCADAQTAAEIRAASAANPPTPFSVEVRDIGDLNEDGRNEFAVDLSSLAVMSTTVLTADAAGCAREVIADGGGVIHKVLRTRTLGWKDLDVGVPLNRAAGSAVACWVTVRAKFDGKKYRMVKIVGVEPFETGESVDLAACQTWAKELLDK